MYVYVCFVSRINGLQLHYDVAMVNQGACIDINDLRMRRRKWQQNLNWEIQKVTLELIVNIFRSVSLTSFIKYTGLLSR